MRYVARPLREVNIEFVLGAENSWLVNLITKKIAGSNPASAAKIRLADQRVTRDILAFLFVAVLSAALPGATPEKTLFHKWLP